MTITLTLIDGIPHLTVPVAAQLEGVSRQAIWDACRTGRLPATRVGRFWYVKLARKRYKKGGGDTL